MANTPLPYFIDLQPIDDTYSLRYEVYNKSGDSTGEYMFLKYAPGELVDTPTPLNAATFNPIVEKLNNTYTKTETNTQINTLIREYMTANYENGNTGAY